MNQFWGTFITGFLCPALVLAAGGDSIRSAAPVTALILDARDGNEGPLLKAYFEEGLEFFLDIRPNSSRITQELYHLREIGRAIEAGDFVSAHQRLRAVQRFPHERLYLSAVLDAAQRRYEAALEGFRQLIDNRTNLSAHLRSLAFMGAARIFHEIGDYKAAIYHYNQVRQLEREFFQATFEKAWSFYLDGDMNGSLGVTLTFLSPYFDKAFFPETFVVRAASFFQLCYFDRARTTVESFKREYAPLVGQIENLQRRDPKSWLFDDRVLKSVNPRLMAALIMDQRFRAAMKAFLLLQDEARKHRGSDVTLTTEALAHLRETLIRESSRVLDQTRRHLRSILSQMDLIEIEILQASANQLLGQSLDPAIQVKTMDLGSVDFDELVQFWPFKGEFWVDELGSYYYGLRSNCS